MRLICEIFYPFAVLSHAPLSDIPFFLTTTYSLKTHPVLQDFTTNYTAPTAPTHSRRPSSSAANVCPQRAASLPRPRRRRIPSSLNSCRPLPQLRSQPCQTGMLQRPSMRLARRAGGPPLHSIQRTTAADLILIKPRSQSVSECEGQRALARARVIASLVPAQRTGKT